MCVLILQIQVGAAFCREEIPAFTGWSLAVATRLDSTVSAKRATQLAGKLLLKFLKYLKVQGMLKKLTKR